LVAALAGCLAAAPAGAQQDKDRTAYVQNLIRTFTTGPIVELDAIPKTDVFARFLESQAAHDGIGREELERRILGRGVMKYLIDQLRNGGLSLTEYINLRPDIHWVEALRMAYVGKALDMGPEFVAALTGQVTAGVEALRRGKDVVVREISYGSSVEKLSPLYAEVAYDPEVRNAPIMVLMHGDVPGTRMASIAGGYAYAKKGFFAVVPSLRGRDGSAGEPDMFVREIFDIYDAVEHAKQLFPAYLDSSNVNITGGSGGGMASIAAAVRFPDYFRFVLPFYGVPDLGHWLRGLGMSGKSFEGWRDGVKKQGWPDGSVSLFANIVQGLGGMPDQVPDKTLARDNILGAGNNPYAQIHFYWDEQDGQVPSITERNLAYAEKARQLGYDNVRAHYSKRGDPVRYIHWVSPDNSVPQQYFVPRILAGSHPAPVLADAGRLTVLGYVKTRRFFVWLGRGDDAVARLDYQLSPGRGEFRFRRVSSDPTVQGRLTFLNPGGVAWTVEVDHRVVRTGIRDREIAVEHSLDAVVVLRHTSLKDARP
jgi:hypothetical protein